MNEINKLITNFIPNPIWLLSKFEHIACHINRFHSPEINMYSYILTNFVFSRGRSHTSREVSGECLVQLKTVIGP